MTCFGYWLPLNLITPFDEKYPHSSQELLTPGKARVTPPQTLKAAA